MSALKAQAIEMIEDVPEERMSRLIMFISTLTPRQEDIARKRRAFDELKAIREAHIDELPYEIDCKKELQEALADAMLR